MKIPPHKKPDPERINLTPIPMTPEGIERLREKLERLKARLPALAEETSRTAAFGDRSDNAEYKAAKGALRYATYESYRIEDQLKRVVPIERGSGADGIVRLGSSVTVAAIAGDGAKTAHGLSATGDKEMTYEILGPTETNPTKGRISNQSPLGTALIGKKKGAVVIVETANGRKEYRIVDVR
jgi:transcription elongation factor GreA